MLEQYLVAVLDKNGQIVWSFVAEGNRESDCILKVYDFLSDNELSGTIHFLTRETFGFYNPEYKLDEGLWYE